MKKAATQGLILIGLFIAGVAVSRAQTVGLRVDIPFQFNVGEKVLPAGQYLIRAPQGGTLRITGPNGAAAIATTTLVSGQRPDGPGMIAFNCYGQRCFVSQFWTARTETGEEIIKGRLERDLANSKEEFTTIALRGNAHR
jgi:hypothetical protein